MREAGSRRVRNPGSPRAAGATGTITVMGRIRGWPDQPGGLHQPDQPTGAVDSCLNCCAFALVALVIGVCLLGYWITHAVRIPF